MTKRGSLVVLVLVATAALGAWLLKGPAGPQQAQLVFGTGPVGGSWYPLATSAAEVWRRELGVRTHVELGGAEANLRGLQMGTYDLGLSHSFAAYNASRSLGAFEGEPPYDKLRGLAVLYPNVQQQVVFADSNIHSVRDLARRVIVPGPPGFGGETIARLILEQYGLSYASMGRVEHVGYSDAVALMKDRHVDMFWPCALVPMPSIAELASLGPGVRLLPLDDEVIEAIEAQNPGLRRHVIPGGSYRGQPDDVQTITTFTVIIVSADLADDLVYDLTRSLVEGRKALLEVSRALAAFNPESAAVAVGVDLHPGARRYYQELGVLP